MIAKKVTKDQADQIIADTSKGPMRQCVACWRGQWYDIRGMSPQEILEFQSELTSIPKSEIPSKSININL